MIRLSPAKDGSTYIIEVSFFDHNKEPATPHTIEWSLFDGNGAAVNGREKVSVFPISKFQAVLFGPDLDADIGTSKAHKTRRFYVRALYSAIIDGVAYDDLPVTDAVEFFIEDLPEPPVVAP